MSQVTCSRCGTTADGLEKVPLPGPVGRQVLDQSCRNCWEAWKQEQVKMINEYRLSVLDPEHYDRLVAAMGAFLNLQDEGGDTAG